MASASGYLQSPDGAKYIPATQRADGTWRKPRRVKEGYVPQEEIPLYESKGKQFASRQQTNCPVGLTPEIIAAASKNKKKPQTSNIVSPIPGLIINVENNNKKKKKKKTGVEAVTDQLANTNIKSTSTSVSTSTNSTSVTLPSQTEPVKRLRNLKKKLREIEALEDKINSGEVKNPEKEQLDKVSKKKEVLSEIASLEVANLSD